MKARGTSAAVFPVGFYFIVLLRLFACTCVRTGRPVAYLCVCDVCPAIGFGFHNRHTWCTTVCNGFNFVMCSRSALVYDCVRTQPCPCPNCAACASTRVHHHGYSHARHVYLHIDGIAVTVSSLQRIAFACTLALSSLPSLCVLRKLVLFVYSVLTEVYRRVPKVWTH